MIRMLIFSSHLITQSSVPVVSVVECRTRWHSIDPSIPSYTVPLASSPSPLFQYFRLRQAPRIISTGVKNFTATMTSPLAYEKVWFEKSRYDEAERQYFEKLAKGSSNSPLKNSLAGEVAKVRQHIQNSLECMDGIAALATNVNVEIVNRLNAVEKNNQDLTALVSDLQSVIKTLESRVKTLESRNNIKSPAVTKPAPAAPPKTEKSAAQDDDVDLFGSDDEEESEAIKKVKEEAAAASKKKSKKQELIQKSIIILDVKPWDDETDMKAMEENVRKISTDGLLWGASKFVPLAYGIHKLQISCVVEDEKVSIDWLQETIQELEDYVQSVDIAAFNKV